MMPLTRPEAKVEELLLLGYSSKEIGTLLGKSHRTVDEQRYAVLAKRGARNVLELLRVKMGLPLRADIPARECKHPRGKRA